MSLHSFLQRWHHMAPPVEDSVDVEEKALIDQVTEEAADQRRTGLAETRAIRARIAGQWEETWDRMHFAQERLEENDIAGALERSFVYRKGDRSP
jgi:hypothetical protein